VFRCKGRQSEDELYCKWRRDSILRCSITTEIKTKNANGEDVKSLEPLGSLYHPQCINDKCRWDAGKPERTIVRFEMGQLVTREMSKTEAEAIRIRAKGKWFGRYQDFYYPMSEGPETYAREPTAETVKKRKIICVTPSAGPSSTRRNDQRPVSESTQLPITPESQLDSPIKPNKKRRIRTRAKSFNAELHAASRDMMDDDNEVHMPDSDDSDDSQEGLVDGIMLKDQYFLPKWRYHRLVAERRDYRSQLRKTRRAEEEWQEKVDEAGGVAQEWKNKADEARQAEEGWRKKADLADQGKQRWKDKAEKALRAEQESTKKADNAQKVAREWKDQAEMALQAGETWKGQVEEARATAKDCKDKADRESALSQGLREQVQVGDARLNKASETNEALKTENERLREELRAWRQEIEGIRATLRQIAGIGGSQAT